MREMGQDLRVIDLGLRSYRSVLQFQTDLVGKRKRGEVPDTLILVEHYPVYTLGRSADESNVLASKRELKKKGMEIIRTGRGGDITYHGPGQLVGYPIIDLRANGKRVLWYVGSLDRIILATLEDFGVPGTTEKKHRGVWFGDNKVAALGVRVTGGITMHGFALNVLTNLEAYKGIVPCGIEGKGVTSLHLLVSGISMKEVKERLVGRFKDEFGYE